MVEDGMATTYAGKAVSLLLGITARTHRNVKCRKWKDPHQKIASQPRHTYPGLPPSDGNRVRPTTGKRGRAATVRVGIIACWARGAALIAHIPEGAARGMGGKVGGHVAHQVGEVGKGRRHALLGWGIP